MTGEGPGGRLPQLDAALASRTGARLVRPGPRVSPAEAAQVVDALRGHARAAEDHIRETTRLEAPGAGPTLVVDRGRWIEANAATYSRVLADLDGDTRSRPVQSAATSVQLGALLAVLAQRVLGQFDPFDADGRLLLVAPNVVHVERELRVPPEDFRLWVCLHEETHRVQFGHAPWLAEHLRGIAGRLLRSADLGGAETLARLAGQVGRRRGRRSGSAAEGSLAVLLATPEQRELVDQVTAVMSLLEGHADVMMDRVGPAVVPSVRQIRARFSGRRSRRGFDLVVRRLLGLEAKLAQYRDGAAFVRHVVRRRGVDGFNTVFTGPETLPTLAEIHQPARWVQRVGV
ncbi:coenzyme F420 biosynthesis-associated protein [Desertihabitans brevis]|uniref:Coenzyme F420 biosynthesis-associated protein n=1 Tax=Desertihabitans brevis TaxID=2268447 RepID=A0A367YTR7_9ACTN|nr:zinc-dependent metalloprotease [Desertihabitans brevis]RCK69283.1 coenzyme F420 biosynthesis-associated protein [Desertihabitans brevis]